MKILYEAQEWYGLSIPFIILCLVDLALLFLLCFLWRKRSVLSAKITTIFVIVVLTFIIGTLVFSHVDARKKVYNKYIEGDYLIVEGEVENYMPDPDGANLPDRFSVDDIDFAIPGFTTCWGYPLRQVDGGELQNGVNVKIYYIPYKFENVIMKIVIFNN
mgnify:FL=1